MNKTKKIKYSKLKSFISGLQVLVNSLPTEDEKQELRKNVNAIIDFFKYLNNNIGEIPSIENTEKIKINLQKMEEILLKIESDQLLSIMAGLKKPAIKKYSKPKIEAFYITNAKLILSELEKLPIDEIKKKLENNKYNVLDLKAIAHIMNIKSIENYSAATLIHQIAMKIANYRGYQKLSGRK